MEIIGFNVRELTEEELIMINGGSKIGDFFASIWDAIQLAFQWIREKIMEWYIAEYKEYLEEQNMNLY